MNRGVNHQPTFFGDDDRIEFGRRLDDIHDRFGVETLAYCLLDNHYHLVLRTPEGNLSDAMQHLGLVYTRHTNDRVGRDGPLFRGRYHAIRVTTDPYLCWVTRYVHRNALDVRGVSHPAGYRWSSYRAYLGLRPSPAFLRTEFVLGHYDNDRRRLARFTDGEPVPGGGLRTLSDVLQLVELAVARDDLLYGDDQARRWTGRTALLLLTTRLEPGALRDELVAHCRAASPDASSAAMRRALARAADPVIARIVDRVLADLETGLLAA